MHFLFSIYEPSDMLEIGKFIHTALDLRVHVQCTAVCHIYL